PRNRATPREMAESCRRRCSEGLSRPPPHRPHRTRAPSVWPEGRLRSGPQPAGSAGRPSYAAKVAIMRGAEIGGIAEFARPRLACRGLVAFLVMARPARRLGNLPAEATSFVGRR